MSGGCQLEISGDARTPITEVCAQVRIQQHVAGVLEEDAEIDSLSGMFVKRFDSRNGRIESGQSRGQLSRHRAMPAAANTVPNELRS